MVHAALLLLMLEAVTTDLVFTISLKRSTQNLQLSTSSDGRSIFCHQCLVASHLPLQGTPLEAPFHLPEPTAPASRPLAEAAPIET
jgi:hypothetical protein